MKDVTQKIRELLALAREVDEWREEQDPGTPEWHTLCEMSDRAMGLIFSLPTELLPEEEVRHPHPNEYAVIDGLLATLDEIEHERAAQ